MYNSNYTVISGDGTGVNGDKQAKVAFELKYPIPGKVFAPYVCNSLPVYYSTQVLSQMASKLCCRYANECYTLQSSTLICGDMDTDLWMRCGHMLTNNVAR